MFGLGKKKVAPAPAPETALAAPAATAKLDIKDDQFIVMPEEYLPKGPEKSNNNSNSKIYLLIAGAAFFLLVLAGILYWWLFANNPTPPAPVAAVPTNNAPDNNTATTTAETQKIITSQALDGAGQLLGSIKISLPSLVANKYGEALGVAVLAAADISLPEGSAVIGGIYSPYPVGAAFDEAVNIELTAVNLANPETQPNYYPAYLKGTAWQEISPASQINNGWAFSFDKFPSGPMAIVERAAAAATTTPNTLGSVPTPSVDTDADGLTDAEEVLLGTNPDLADTDGDTYADRAEIFGGYSPLAIGAKLEGADLLATYTNPTYGYKAPYPKKWLADSLDQTNKQVLFISATEEFFEILVEDNPLKKPIVDWYRSQSPALSDVELNVTTVDSAPAVWSPDGLTLYIGRDGLVYIITYNKGTVEQINWPVLFEYFYKNFKFGNTATPTDNSAPAAAPVGP